MPTFLPCACSSLTLSAFWPGSTSANTVSMPSSPAMRSAVARLSPVSMATWSRACAASVDRLPGGRSDGIGDGDEPDELAVDGDVDHRAPCALPVRRLAARRGSSKVDRWSPSSACDCRPARVLPVDLRPARPCRRYSRSPDARRSASASARGVDDRLRQRDAREPARRRQRAAALVFASSGLPRHHVHDLGLAHRQRAGLVEDDTSSLRPVPAPWRS